jgi:AbrB family looped-hinge helix DNA binding protein
MRLVDMASTVGERGQVTIEKAIREELGVYGGDIAVQRLEGRRVVIEFVPAPHRRSLAGVLGDKVGRRPADESWSAIRDAAASAADPDRATE